MPPTEVFFYQDEDGCSPVVDWLRKLRATNRKGFAKCLTRIRRLAQAGHEQRRPEAAPLRDGTHELRAWQGRVNYRLLYFFHGRNVAILAHAITKEAEVPDIEIERALERKAPYENAPEKYTYQEDPGLG